MLKKRFSELFKANRSNGCLCDECKNGRHPNTAHATYKAGSIIRCGCDCLQKAVNQN